MATESAVKDMSLRQLLDGLTLAHRQDIQDFGGGHLNENKLWKPKEQSTHQSWEGAHKPHINMVPRSKLIRTKKDSSHTERMEDTMIQFSIGTVGTLPVPPVVPRPPSDMSPHGHTVGAPPPSEFSKIPEEEEVQMSEAQTQRSAYTGKKIALIEELSLPEMMLTKPNYPGPEAAEKDKAQKLGWTKDENLHHHFIPGYQDAVTMKEQYNKFVDFESGVLRKQDTIERKILSGAKAVNHLERKLHESLNNMPYSGYGPNFHRLQLYSSIMEDLIDNSPTFGYTLNNVKREYDDYLATLLDGQPSRHKALYHQVERLTQKGPSGSGLLQMEKGRVSSLEDDAKRLLEENEELRTQLKEEEELAALPEPEPKPKVYLARDEPALELADQVEEVHATILERLDEMNELRHLLRTHYVPSTVCTHLEQCIKETEVEFQKLKSQKDYFDRNISEMEKELQGSIDAADTTDKDAKRVWKKVTAVKADKQGKIMPDDSDDEGEDESKWSWYIS